MAIWRPPLQPSYADGKPMLGWFRMFAGAIALAGFMAASWYFIAQHRVKPLLLPLATEQPQPRTVIPPQSPLITPPPKTAVATPATPKPATVPPKTTAEPHLAIGIPMLEKHTYPPAPPLSDGPASNLVTGLPWLHEPANATIAAPAEPPSPPVAAPTAPAPPAPPAAATPPPKRPSASRPVDLSAMPSISEKIVAAEPKPKRKPSYTAETPAPYTGPTIGVA